MNAKWKENTYKWKEDERKWMQIGMNMKGIWKETERKLQNNSSIDFQACVVGTDFGFMLDLEYADFYKTLESDRPPQKR